MNLYCGANHTINVSTQALVNLRKTHLHTPKLFTFCPKLVGFQEQTICLILNQNGKFTRFVVRSQFSSCKHCLLTHRIEIASSVLTTRKNFYLNFFFRRFIYHQNGDIQ